MLDEATSVADTGTEAVIRKALSKVFKDRTTYGGLNQVVGQKLFLILIF
jgi:ABC-type transport system involved in Fe-S cluster assembly fused permease/ATPase subunit